MQGYGYDSGYGGRYTGYGEYGSTPSAPERESRRKKLAAMAGSVYRAGVAAASELKEQYNQSRAVAATTRSLGAAGGSGYGSGNGEAAIPDIPSSFPHVPIITGGEEQMIVFPTYAKRHVRESAPAWFLSASGSSNPGAQGMSEEEYWKRQWMQMEDEKAIVDVDVRGWIYTPHKGPLTRRNRMVLGLARKLSGISSSATAAAQMEQQPGMVEDEEQRKIAREAREIEARFQMERDMASRGQYSEPPSGSGGNVPISRTDSLAPPSRTPTTMSQTDMTESEMATANANLMARIGPFMTTPLVQAPITIFLYNDRQSRSYTVTTDEKGHFNARVALDFVPSELRILATEKLSTTRPVEVIGDRGVSLISDVDDTVKKSNIGLGTREIFRNVFVRDLADQKIDGVREWYRRMSDLGVEMHYCSNSPWQLFPVLASFFHIAGLPRGSMHLKHYSGMLQGIFEPVAERKKGTLEGILRDFPQRKFLLVGDSGEADLEVYTELALANPGRILAVFIRDVTTPEQPGFFDSSFNPDVTQRAGNRSPVSSAEHRPRPPPPLSRTPTAPPANSGPAMGTLIDFAEPITGTGRQVPPPRPAKPAALRSTPSDGSSSSYSDLQRSTTIGPGMELPIRPRTSAGTPPASKPTPPPPPPPRRSGTGSLSPGQQSAQQEQPPPLPQRTGITTASRPPNPTIAPVVHRDTFPSSMPGAYPSSPTSTATTAANDPMATKKVELWLRRLARAHELLDSRGVRLYTWRRGEDVIAEAEGIVREALKGMGVPAGRR
ncbi:hypothetical protein VTJ04DRAFT_3879 [Mycothermus thermophilus]|uniref:uncharacterized protein n=1 Tax=Humicola insolens TaxID=85995 RepID=UPI0037439AE9